MDIIKYNVYSNPNIGVYINGNDEFVFLPHGLAKTKAQNLAKYLKTDYIFTSVADTRLLGILMVVNNYGMLLPKTCHYSEIEYLKRNTKLNVEVLDVKYTALGNIICVNDRGGIISPIIPNNKIKKIEDVLGIEVIQSDVAGYNQVGAMFIANSCGGVIHPRTNIDNIKSISDILKINIVHTTINSGVPFVSSGMIINNKSVVVGESTNGSEIITLTKLFIS